MNKIGALVLVGGEGKRLKGLTKNVAKPYVSFFGKYRLIDFTLSSLSMSHISDVGLITQYKPFELMKYIGNGSNWDLNIDSNGISFLTPHATGDSLTIQKGTANAVLSEIDYVKSIDAEYILILSGDQVYRMDFREVLDFHKKNNASLTIISYEYENKKDLSRFGIIEADDKGRIKSFEEKPKKPKSNLVSMGIYLFNKSTLLKYITLADKLTDFGKDLIPYIISHEKKVYTFKNNRIFFDLGTVESLFNANMFFLDNFELAKDTHTEKVYSKPLNYPPHIIRGLSDVKESLVSDGVIINSSKVYHSVISLGSKVKKGSNISYSVILPDAVIGENSVIKNAIIDEGLTINDNSTLVFSEPTLVDKYSYKDGKYNG